MHPAFSVVLFTTLSGAGYGLWTWLGLRLALATTPQRFEPMLLVMLVLGGILVSVGLLASLWHLGKPMRAWRAFSQWRTSWLSREGVMAVSCYLPALVIAGLLLAAPLSSNGSIALRIAGIALVAFSLATIGCTAMIYASLKPIPAWRHPLVAPVYFAFALFTGALLHQALLGRVDPAGSFALLLLPAALAMIKWLYWQAIDREPLPATRGDAVGLPGRQVGVFERPHTESNYLTREMGFVLARKHARKLRLVSLVLFAGLPMVAVVAALLLPALQWPLLVLAALAALTGTLVERWLFFAQARHLVTLYY